MSRIAICIATLILPSVAAAQGFPDIAPVYEVVRQGVSEKQVSRLGEMLGLGELRADKYGALRFTDSAAFQYVPTVKLSPGNNFKSEDRGELVFEGFDYESIKKIEVLDKKSATEKFSSTLQESGLLPDNSAPLTSHTQLQINSVQGEVLLDQAIDTVVSYQFNLEEFPLEGPGAKIRATFSGSGEVTQITHAFRELKKVGDVAVIGEKEATERCARWTTLSGLERHSDVVVSLAYYAPPLMEKLERLEPSVRCALVDGNGVASQIYFVPALVNADHIKIDLPRQRRRKTAFNLFDLNLISTAHAAFNRRDVGSEGTGPCSGLPNTAQNVASFNNRMAADGVAVQFSWLDANAWEQDWKDPSKSGDDSDWVDDVDMAYWQGHGWPGGFSFSGCSSNDDASMTNSDALWGNRNVEWVSLFTCLILAEESGGQSWWQRWGPAFDRLHQINSFDTVSYHSAQHGGIFADYMLKTNPLNVRQAWTQASIDDQPAQVIWATMGVVSEGALSNFNDYYWGKGSVGPDISANQIQGYWRISGGS